MLQQDYWNERRSIRKYLDKEVPFELIDNILKSAMHAPTTGNMQLYHTIVTTDRSILNHLCTAHFNQPAAANAPMLITVCADVNRFSRWAEISGAKPGFYNFQSFIAAMLDATIYAQQIVSIAENNDLATCYLGTTTYNAPEITKILQLPKGVVPIITISLGYPAEEGTLTDRLPLEAVRSVQTFHKATDKELKEWYEEKESLPENQQFVKENNKQSLAEVFTDVRYPSVNNVAFSEKFFNHLKENGLI